MTKNANDLDSFNGIVRAIVRGNYSLQKLRIQMENRISANWKDKLGFESENKTQDQIDKQEKKIIKILCESFAEITDTVVMKVSEQDDVLEDEAIPEIGKLPSVKRFKGNGTISKYSELVLMSQYIDILRAEKTQFKMLKSVLKGIPIYDKFLSSVSGIGPAMAGVIISEINIHVAEYPSSLHMYAGLDTVVSGMYKDENGKECRVPSWEINAYYEDPNNEGQPMLYKGKYLVDFRTVGRTRKEESLVKRTYIDKDGVECVRNSISFNPFLKTKLVGVLGTSFLRAGSCYVDGKKMGAPLRKKLAASMGFEGTVSADVDNFLRSNGHAVEYQYSKYGKIYNDYKNRLDNDVRHTEKTKQHKHNMAIRYAVKRFLVDLYVEWRTLEGLPVAEEYSVAKLGYTHGKAGGGKPSHNSNQ